MNRCVLCGTSLNEGRLVCDICAEEESYRINKVEIVKDHDHYTLTVNGTFVGNYDSATEAVIDYEREYVCNAT